MTSQPKRRQKSPAERAQEALGVAARRYKRAQDRVYAANRAVVAADAELDAATRRLEYVRANPDLPPEVVPVDGES